MDSKEAIIGTIMSEAEEKAAKIAQKGNEDADKLISDAKAFAEELNNKLKSEYASDEAETLRRRKTVAALDAKKLVLKAKQEVLSEVFLRAYDKLCALQKSDYLALVDKLLVLSAEDRDEVVLSDDGVITDGDIKTLGIYKERNLTVSPEKGDFKGGVKLIGKICDKDLSFRQVLDEKKDSLSAKIAEELFS
ncbi:MAG TPA: hypothetical protein DHU65_02620 [Clostridiales bacterium]|nr:hypothetical protein [Clostridiales bacterium]